MEACKEILNSRSLRKIMEVIFILKMKFESKHVQVVLAVGNYLNFTKFIPATIGFHISFLSKVSNHHIIHY
jgi:hypothetical protein